MTWRNLLSTTRRITWPEAAYRDTVPASQLGRGDVVRLEPGQIIPADGEVIEGIASVDESAITGESAPVIRESGGDRSAVTGGAKEAIWEMSAVLYAGATIIAFGRSLVISRADHVSPRCLAVVLGRIGKE